MGKYRYNRYKDVEIDVSKLSFDSDDDFVRVVSEEERKWHGRLRSQRDWQTAVMWLNIPIRYAGLVSVLVSLKHPFVVHHATRDHIMVVRKALQSSSFACVPSYGTHYVKVDCIVYEEGSGRVLMVYEKPYYPLDPVAVKLVTGSVNSGEFFADAAVREVWEETRVRSSFLGFIGCLNRLRTRFDRDEIAYGCILVAQKDQFPVADGMEVASACWITQQEAMASCTPAARNWFNLAASAPQMMRKCSVDDPFRPQKIDLFYAPAVISQDPAKK